MFLHIEFKGGVTQTIQTIEIYNTTGELILSAAEQNEIQISQLTAGMYHIKITDNENRNGYSAFQKTE